MDEKCRGFSSLPKVLIFILALSSSCGERNPSNTKESPATIQNPVKETSLTTISLTESAEQRLGIETAPATYQSLPDRLKLGGEIISIPGTEMNMSAPAAGVISFNNAGTTLHPGSEIRRGQEIMRLLLMPSEKDLMGTNEEVNVRQIEFEVARAEMERAEQLIKKRSISEKTYQNIRAGLANAQAALQASKAKYNLLSGISLDSAANALSTIILDAPANGILQQLYVAPGQTVPASAPLFMIANQNPVWVRVPVYSGDLARIDRKKSATVQPLGKNEKISAIKAEPVKGPPSSDANSATSDLYYQLKNQDRLFRIGERVKVTLILTSEENTLTVPWSSISYDIYGGTWIYINDSPHIYVRRRIEISRVINDYAVISRGVSEGEAVVTAGVAELYGSEFGGEK